MSHQQPYTQRPMMQRPPGQPQRPLPPGYNVQENGGAHPQAGSQYNMDSQPGYPTQSSSAPSSQFVGRPSGYPDPRQVVRPTGPGAYGPRPQVAPQLISQQIPRPQNSYRPTLQPVQQPLNSFTQQPVQQPLNSFNQQPVQQPLNSFNQQPVQQPLNSFTQQPVQQPTMNQPLSQPMAQQSFPQPSFDTTPTSTISASSRKHVADPSLQYGGQGYPAQGPRFSQATMYQPGHENTQSAYGSVNQVANQFGYMNIQSAPSQPQISQFNILASPPAVMELDQNRSASSLNADQSQSRSPHAICSSTYMRFTTTVIPQTPNLHSKSKIPLAIFVTPYRQLEQNEMEVPVINPEMIVRCRRCRSYINPWVEFAEGGSKWTCNLCYLHNEIPTFYDYDTNTNQPVDRMARYELTHSVVEYVAPQEYMVRPPQPTVFLFIFDVSFASVQSGMLAVAAQTILETLDKFPNADNRTQIGFIGVDSSLHFVGLNSNSNEPQILVVSDMEEIFLPLPYDLLVPLSECRVAIESFLAKMGTVFVNTQESTNALGKGLLFAQKLIAPIGGKIIVLQSTLPNVDDGALKPREDPKLFGTPKESQLLQPASPFYKNFAIECSKSHVSVDMFLFNSQYVDIASLTGCTKFTAGTVYYYPGFNASRVEDVQKFKTEFSHFLGRPLGLEAVLRVRASKGIQMRSFHGNFFLRSSDLLALPNVSPDHSFCIEMSLEEAIEGSVACFQAALLHTSCNGERRIRVITVPLGVSSNLADIFSGIDPLAVASLLAKKGVERTLVAKLEDARDAINHKLGEILSAYKVNFTSSGQAMQLLLTENMKNIPVLILGLLRNAGFRASSMIPSDLRSYLLSTLYSAPPEIISVMLYPRFWRLHSLQPQEGVKLENGQVQFPPRLNLSSEKLERHGIFMMDTVFEIFIWVGRATPPELMRDMFGKYYDQLPDGKTKLQELDTDMNRRLLTLVKDIQFTRLRTMTLYPTTYIVREDGDPNMRAWFLSYMVEDRLDITPSYPQFLAQLREQIAK